MLPSNKNWICVAHRVWYIWIAKRHASFGWDFIGLACKFTALLKKSHSLLNDPRTEHLKKSMYNLDTTLASLLLIGSSSILQITRTAIKSRMGSKFCQIIPPAAELPALERQEKFPKTYNGRNVVTTLVPSFLDESSSLLQPYKLEWVWILLRSHHLLLMLASLEHLKNQSILWPLLSLYFLLDLLHSCR